MKAAKKMVNQHKVKEKHFKVVAIRIPRINCTCTDFPRIPCIVVTVQGKAQRAYHLAKVYTYKGITVSN